MSEQTRSNDPVVTALNLEREIARKLEQPSDRTRKEVRSKMEDWLELMQDKKARTQYAEELGELDPSVAERELLVSIQKVFPKIATDLGYTKDMETQPEETEYGQAA